MNFIYFFTIFIVIFFTYSALAKPWVTEKGKFELISSDTFYFSKFPSILSEKKYLVQEEIAESSNELYKTSSRKQKAELSYKISTLKIVDKHLSNYYEKYSKYFGLEYGLAKNISLGIHLNQYEIGNFEKASNKFIISPHLSFALLKGKNISMALHSKFQTIYFNNEFKHSVDLGISLGSVKLKKKKKYFNHCSFALNTDHLYQFNLTSGIEDKAGYMGIISTSYFKSLRSNKDIHSDKLRLELFLAKKLNSLKDSKYSISVFISYFTEYSRYSKINISNGIQIGFYYK